MCVRGNIDFNCYLCQQQWVSVICKNISFGETTLDTEKKFRDCSHFEICMIFCGEVKGVYLSKLKWDEIRKQ